MADSTDRKRTPAPNLLEPTNESVVDGRSVTFRWEPVEGATEYAIEVAVDTDFKELVFEQHVEGGKTALSVANVFGTEGQTYLWRVLAKSELGWSNGDRVESFIAASPDMAAPDLERPDEELGPYPALIKASAAGAAAEATSSEELKRLQEEGVAPEGVPAGQVLAIAASIVIAIVGIVFVLFALTGDEYTEVLDLRYDEADYFDLRKATTDATAQLTQYEVVDDSEGAYRIPIVQAMDLLVYQEQQTYGARTFSSELPLLPRQQQALVERPEAVGVTPAPADTAGAAPEAAATSSEVDTDDEN